MLPTCVNVGGYECPISISAQWITLVSCPFSKAALISYSTAKDTIFISIFHNTCLGLFSLGAALERSSIKSLKKKYSPILLLVIGITRHAPLLFTYKTISDVACAIVPLGKAIR